MPSIFKGVFTLNDYTLFVHSFCGGKFLKYLHAVIIPSILDAENLAFENFVSFVIAITVRIIFFNETSDRCDLDIKLLKLCIF